MNMLHVNENVQAIQLYCTLPESFPGVAVILVRTVQKDRSGEWRRAGKGDEGRRKSSY